MTSPYSRLSRKRLKLLPTGKRITENGITVERTKDGDIRYEVNIMVDRQRIHRVVGRESDGTTLRQAVDFIVQARAKARSDRLDLPTGRKVALKHSEAAKLYLDRLQEGGGKNLKNKEQHLRLHLVPHLGNIRIDKITVFTLETLKKKLLDSGLTLGTVNRVFATYRHVAGKLLEWEEIRSPMAKIGLEQEDNRREHVLSPGQKDDLLAAAYLDSNPRTGLFVHIGLHTGLRHSEIVGLRLDNIDIERKRMRVRVKGGRLRDQPITPTLTKILQREKDMADSGQVWLFPSDRSSTGHAGYMKKAFRRAVLAAGLDPSNITPHVLRHTAITDLVEAGWDIKTIQSISGHKSLEMVMRYTHPRPQRVDDAMRSLENSSTKRQQNDGIKLVKS